MINPIELKKNNLVLDRGGMVDGKGVILPEGSRSSEWGVYLKKGENYRLEEERNKAIRTGEYFKDYPSIDPTKTNPSTESEMKELMERYHPAWSCVYYRDDSDILFIDLHY